MSAIRGTCGWNWCLLDHVVRERQTSGDTNSPMLTQTKSLVYSLKSPSFRHCVTPTPLLHHNPILLHHFFDFLLPSQAIGRVHRIGQTRESHVHRFIMQESIEVAVADLCQKRGAGMDLASPAAMSKRGGAGGGSGVKGAGEGASLSLGDITSLLMGPG